MNIHRDLQRSEAFAARMAARRGHATLLGSSKTDEGEACDCAPAFGLKTGLVIGVVVAGTIAFQVGAMLADEAHRRKRA